MPSTYSTRQSFEQDYPNIKGTALGPDRDDEHPTLIVLVTRKYDESELAPDDVVPELVTIDGTTYRTDVEPVGIPHALSLTPQDVADHRARHRPIPGGVSIGNESVGAGTMGSPLLEHDGDPVTLTNSHVSGNSDEQYQPAAMDGGAEDEVIGTLREASPLDPSETQTTDSALIDVEPDLVDDRILGLGPLAGIDRGGAVFGRTHLKAGRTTGVTEGTLRGRDAQVNVAYGPDTIRFTGCDVFGDMSKPGDSGSVIGYLDSEHEDLWATDLLFAGSDRATIAIPLTAVEAYHGQLAVPESDGGEDDSDTDVDVGGDSGNGNGSDDSSGGGSDGGSGDDHEHRPERDFEDYVAELLTDEYGEENVDRQYRYPDGRLVDLVAFDTDNNRVYTCELENDSGSLINGAGQALYYRQRGIDEWADYNRVTAVLGFPADHIDDDERAYLKRMGVELWEIAVPYNVSIEGV